MLSYATLGSYTPHKKPMPDVQIPAARDVSNKALHTMEVLFSCFRWCEIASPLISRGKNIFL